MTVEVSSIPGSVDGSLGGIKNVVDITAKDRGIDSRKRSSPGYEIRRRGAAASAGPELRDFGSVPSDDDRLPAGAPVQHFSHVVRQLAHGDRFHAYTPITRETRAVRLVARATFP
jgi:hypothetical protein